MSDSRFLEQAINGLQESNRRIADATVEMKDNLKILNDHNILHHENSIKEHENIKEKLQVLTGKYWYLIVFLIVMLLVVMGHKEAMTALI